jgi:hypothetical protein
MSWQFGPSGGVGGTFYDAPAPTSNGPWRISEIGVRSGNRIDEIEITWSNTSNESTSSPDFGGNGGKPDIFTIPNGDYLTEITGTVDDYDDGVRLFSLQFFTKDKSKSPVYGKQGSGNFSFQCPPGYQITGIIVRSGEELDALGVHIDLIPA